MRAWIVALVLVAASPAAAAPDASTGAAEIADGDLEHVLENLDQPDASARRAAAKAVAALGVTAVPAIGRELARLRKAPSASVTAVVKGLPPGDLADQLLEAPSDAQGHRPALRTAVLLRALAAIATTPAVRQLVKVAVDHGGAFRAEVARHVKTLGDKAVPALLETRKDASSELRHWAYSTLESMGKRVPADAVQTQDNGVLADVLRAFAVIHDMDALPVILSFVNSDRRIVQKAAREAVLEFGQDAVWKLREAYTNLTAKQAPEGLPAADIAKQLFAAYDRLRSQEVNGLLDEGLAQYKAGKLEEAIAAFDKVLARQPMIDRRSEMAGAYYDYALSLEEDDPPRAAALLHEAERLWPESPRATHIQAELAYLDGKELLARNIFDREPFRRALTLDPTHEKARAELERFDVKVEARQEYLRYIVAGVVTVIVAALGAILFARRRHPTPH